ncbi:Na(+) H(+) antiporter subunit C [Myxococcus hansupus]|uniref:Na(+) H(+) antiporter subunit C n=1 Tax=Pseudomyxococcus hansupus TaxID=1297742 RepID=A0A0H4WRL5_9BACT|nr:NADH-quinone oxidoreductase subunit K [Myxococcus hansupus]AKQ66141.1 Na(+) H(+) antiporter subunit C [Myxococcus hansupus]
MEMFLSITVGVLFAAGLYCLMLHSVVRLALGLVLLGSATNLLLFTVNGLQRGFAPLVPEGEQALSAPFADPVPQAFILTAIVINFGLLALLLVLVHRAAQETGTDDTRALRTELKDSEQ